MTVIRIATPSSWGDVAHAPVVATPVTGDKRAAHTPSGELIGPTRANLSAAGAVDLDLPTTTTMVPEGCWYRIETCGHEWRVYVPASGGPYDVGDPDIAAPGVAPAILVPGVVGATVEALNHDQAATVNWSGPQSSRILHFGIPSGHPGALTSATATGLPPGSAPTVSLAGPSTARTMALGIPTGATISGATATALGPGATPTVTVGGTASARTFAFGIPRGLTGAQGIQGPQGPVAAEVSDVHDLLEVNDGDLFFALGGTTATIADGLIGGVIRRSTSVHAIANYTQTGSGTPTDPAMGTGFMYQWNAVIDSTNPVLGAHAQSEHWGARGAFELEGYVQYARNGGQYAIMPIGYADVLFVGNTPGTDRILGGTWDFMSARIIRADDAKVTLYGNDSLEGMAAFVDSNALVSVDGGEMVVNPDPTEHTTGPWDFCSFLSRPVMAGNVEVPRRSAFLAMDVRMGDSDESIYGPGLTGVDVLRANPHLNLEDLDDSNETLEENIGFHVTHLTEGEVNIGLQNGSATVLPPQTSTVTGVSSTIRIDASVVVIDNTAGAPVTLTSTPSIGAGREGQVLTVVNSSAHDVVIQGEDSLTGSGLVGVNRRLTATGGLLDLLYTGGKWRVRSEQAPWIRSVTRPGVAGVGLTGSTTAGITFQRSTHASGGGTYIDIRGTSGETAPDVGFRGYLPGDTAPRFSLTSGGMLWTDGSDFAAATGFGPTETGVLSAQSPFGPSHHLRSRPLVPVTTRTASGALGYVDSGTTVVVNTGSATTQTIDSQATASWHDGTTITVTNRGSGTVTIATATGTLKGVTSLADGETTVLRRLASNYWTSGR